MNSPTPAAEVLHQMVFEDERFTICNFAGDRLINATLETEGVWEPWQLRLMARVLGPKFTCVDIGANIGINALFMARKCPSGRVFALEPVDKTFAMLQRNIDINHAVNLIPVNKGISSVAQTLSMVVDLTQSGGAHVADPARETNEHMVGPFEFVRLEDVLRPQNVSRVDFMKIDAEGHEMEVLQGCGDYLDNPDLQMTIEFNPLTLRSAARSGTPFYDRVLFDKLREKFAHVFFISRAGTLFEVPNYHILRRCLLGGFFVEDLYCVNRISKTASKMVDRHHTPPPGVPVVHELSPHTNAIWLNRGHDGWVCADPYGPSTAQLYVTAPAGIKLRLQFDPIFQKHLPNSMVGSWPVHVLAGEKLFMVDLLNSPATMDLPINGSMVVTIECAKSVLANSYLGNPGDPRQVSFRCQLTHSAG